MDIKEILPILVPGILIQVLVQVYFIHQCWQNGQLSLRTRLLYMAAIALFNIPAAAVYLLFTRKHQAIPANQADKQLRQGIFILLLVAFEIISLRFIVENRTHSGSSGLVWLLGLCFVSALLDVLLMPSGKWLAWLAPLIQVGSIAFVFSRDQGQNAQYLLLIVLAFLLNTHPKQRALPAAGLLFLSSLAGSAYKAYQRSGSWQSDDLISSLYVSGLLFVLVFALFYSFKRQQETNRRLSDALLQLSEQQQELKQMSALAERSRVVGEIHDTVGHTLTTAVIALEESERLAATDANAAVAKTRLARDQVRRGLHDLRGAIRTIQSGQAMPFRLALEALLEQIRRTTGLKVTAVFESEPDLLAIQQRVLLQAVRELATNSLKHGRSRSFDVLVQEHAGTIRLTVSDDGQGTDEIQPGFGLTHLRELVESLGGSLTWDSVPGEGFGVQMVLPTGLAGQEH